MKAWLVKEKDQWAATVVFARTRGQARALAMTTDTCEDLAFCDIVALRRPQMDKYYKKGKREMDWYNAADRIALVRDCDFYCELPEDCENCPAGQFCDTYQNKLREATKCLS